MTGEEGAVIDVFRCNARHAVELSGCKKRVDISRLVIQTCTGADVHPPANESTRTRGIGGLSTPLKPARYCASFCGKSILPQLSNTKVAEEGEVLNAGDGEVLNV